MKTSNNPAPKPASTPAPDNFPVEWLTASGTKAKAIKDWPRTFLKITMGAAAMDFGFSRGASDAHTLHGSGRSE